MSLVPVQEFILRVQSKSGLETDCYSLLGRLDGRNCKKWMKEILFTKKSTQRSLKWFYELNSTI
jgi:hypothetical protein